MKLSRRTVKSHDLERAISVFAQQATASSCISCYCSPTGNQIHFSQINLWSIGVEHSDESLLTSINDRLLPWKMISSCLATSCLIAQYKTYGEQSRAHTLMICKWDANDIHKRKRPISAKSRSHALVHLSTTKIAIAILELMMINL